MRIARKLRIQYRGAMYHVTNRGNYRRDVFGSKGAASAFELALAEASQRRGWRIHVYVVMVIHYHLALETPFHCGHLRTLRPDVWSSSSLALSIFTTSGRVRYRLFVSPGSSARL